MFGAITRIDPETPPSRQLAQGTNAAVPRLALMSEIRRSEIAVSVVYADGRREPVGFGEGDLGEATIAALELADQLGVMTGDGHGPPQSVDVHVGDRLELRISVVRGGLTASAIPRRSRPNG
jgi:hypothetical protein